MYTRLETDGQHKICMSPPKGGRGRDIMSEWVILSVYPSICPSIHKFTKFQWINRCKTINVLFLLLICSICLNRWHCDETNCLIVVQTVSLFLVRMRQMSHWCPNCLIIFSQGETNVSLVLERRNIPVMVWSLNLTSLSCLCNIEHHYPPHTHTHTHPPSTVFMFVPTVL